MCYCPSYSEIVCIYIIPMYLLVLSQLDLGPSGGLAWPFDVTGHVPSV